MTDFKILIRPACKITCQGGKTSRHFVHVYVINGC